MLEEEDDFTEIHTAPKVKATTLHIVAPVTPEFPKVRVQEIFRRLVSRLLRSEG